MGSDEDVERRQVALTAAGDGSASPAIESSNGCLSGGLSINRPQSF
jgi:hypothetical protein